MKNNLEDLLKGYINIITAKVSTALNSDDKEEIKEKYIKILTKQIKDIYEPGINVA